MSIKRLRSQKLTSEVTIMGAMFAGCSGLTTLDVSSFNTSKVTIMQGMFTGCQKMETIFASDKFDVSNVTSSNGMFTYCTSLKGYDESKTDKAYATVNGGYFTNVYRPWVKYADGTLTFQYGYKKALGTDEYWLNEGSNTPGWYAKNSSIKTVVFDNTVAQVRPTSCYRWFNKCSNLSAIKGIENLNTSNVTSMSSMFDNCSGLTSLDFSNFDTSKVTNMSHVFYNCSALTSLNLSKFDTKNATDMNKMFYGCSGFTSLDVSNFDTRNVTDMASMFSGCSKLSAIYWSDKFDADQLSSITNTDILSECPATLYCSPKQYEHFKGSSVIASAGNTVKPYVSINRNMEYGTLCVPVGSSLAEGSFTGFDKLYQVTNADKDKGTITLLESKSIEPGVPYVYHRDLPKNAKSIITFEVDENASAAVSAPKNDGSLLKGTFESMIAPAGKYILQTDGNFHPVAADNTTLKVGAYRAYLDLSSLHVGYAKAYQMIFGGDETTGIDHINGDGSIHGQADQQPKVYIDLMGRKVSAPQKSRIYIVNGKKIVFNK